MLLALLLGLAPRLRLAGPEALWLELWLLLLVGEPEGVRVGVKVALTVAVVEGESVGETERNPRILRSR